MEPTVDPKAAVYEGKAGSGDAVILGDAWKTPLALGNQYGKEDATARSAAAKLAQKTAADKAKADAKLAAEKDKDLKDLMSIDTSKAWEVDSNNIRTEYNGLVEYVQGAMAKGKNPADPKNTVEWGESQRLRKSIQDHASDSMQQGDRFKTLGTLIDGDKDGIYDKQAVHTMLQKYRESSSDERRAMDLKPESFINRGKDLLAIMAKVKQEENKTTKGLDGRGSTETKTTTGYNDDQLTKMAELHRQTQGVDGKLDREYKTMLADPDEKKKWGSTADSFDTWANAKVKSEIKELEATNEQTERSMKTPEATHYPTSAEINAKNDDKKGAESITKAYDEAKDLVHGNTKSFPVQSQKYKGYWENQSYTGMSIGGYQYVNPKTGKPETVDNQIMGVYRDFENNKTYIRTTASTLSSPDPKAQLIEVDENNALPTIIRGIFKKNGGKGDAVDALMVKNGLGTPGSSHVNFGGTSATFDQADYDKRKGTGPAYQARQEKFKTVLLANVDHYDDSFTGDGSADAKRSAAVNTDLAHGMLTITDALDENVIARNVKVDFKAGHGLSRRSIEISYDATDKNGVTTRKTDKITKEKLAAAMATFELDPNANQRVAAMPKRGAAAAQNTTTTTKTTGTSTSSRQVSRGPAAPVTPAASAPAASVDSAPAAKGTKAKRKPGKAVAHPGGGTVSSNVVRQ